MIVFVLWSCWGWIFNWIRAGELCREQYVQEHTSTYTASPEDTIFRKLWGLVGK